MIKFELESESVMVDFMKDRFLLEDSLSLVVSKLIARELLDSRTFECKSLIKEINDEDYIYLISKDTTANGDIYLCIEPITFSEDCGMDMEIEGSFIIVQEGLLDEQELDEIYFSEELIVVDFKDDCEEELESDEETCLHDCRFCNECDDDEEILDEDTNLELVQAVFNKFGTSFNVVGTALSSLKMRLDNKQASEELDALLEKLVIRETGGVEIESEDFEDVITAKLEFIEDILENYGEISLITDFETAKAIVAEYSIFDFEDDFSITLHSDLEGYLVEITEAEIFVIEPIIREGGYFTIETECLYIDDDIDEYLDIEFFEHLNVEEIRGVLTEEE